MVVGVVDQPVVREDDAFRAARGFSGGVDVALGVDAPLLGWKQTLAVAEGVASDRAAPGVRFKRAAAPAEFAGLGLCDEVRRQVTVGVDIERDVVL